MYYFCALIVLFSSFFSAPIHSNYEPALFVKLETEQQLQPLFLTHFRRDRSEFPPEYLTKLEEVLIFDFENSERFELLTHTAERELLSKSDLCETGMAVRWRGMNALYVVKAGFYQKNITFSILLAGDNRLIALDPIDLTGNLSKDRQSIHRAADTIIKIVTGQPGIASTRLLYTHKYRNRAANQWISELWECDYDGWNNRKIDGLEGGYCVTPQYIPPKPGYLASAFFYVSYKNGQPKIYLAPLSGGIEQRLLHLRGNQLMPAISRQRDQIAFISDITGNPDLFLQEFDPEKGPLGKPRQIFTTHQATQGSPTFSPDGKQIAFVSNKDGCPRIYVIPIPAPETKLKDIKARLISRCNRESTAPCWSPDGKKLAYCARSDGGTRQLWIYDFESQEESCLTGGPVNKENPSWAPDSMHIVYNTTGNRQAELYFIGLHHRVPVKIYNTLPGERRFPAWEPKAD